MTALVYLLGVVFFAVGLIVSVALHELGHLIPGKLYNVKVTQYFVGFGRTLFSRQVGETEYGLKAIPLGGYCKLVGMLPPEGLDPETGQERLRSRNTGMFAQLVSDARAAEYEQIEAHDHGRLFYDKPWWQRVIIMGSGVATNIVLALLLFAAVFMIHGIAEPTTTIGSVSQCVIAQRADEPQRACRDSDPESPAKAAGLMPGDRIVSYAGTPVHDWDTAQRLIRADGDRTATMIVDRDGRAVQLHVTPTVNTVVDPDGSGTLTKAGFLGVTPGSYLDHKGLGYTVHTMATGTWETLKTIGTLPAKVYHVGRAVLGLEKRDPNGPMSVVGAGRVAGELTTAPGTTFSDGFFSILLLLAGLNLFLGLINLVPLPPFDGGGIATTLYETLRRGIARLAGRPDPGGVDSAKLLPLTYVMAVVILVVSVVLIFGDIFAPISVS